MKKHVRTYLDENGYDEGDVIMCEMQPCGVSNSIHHISRRGMGGDKSKDVNENLVALCQKHHAMADANQIPEETLFETARRRINANLSD